jgi:hypothetical protein
MTFEEWIATRYMNGIYLGDLKAAWEAGVKAEREACAKVCDEEATEAFGEDADEWARGACMCAAMIRERSNTGA